MFLQGRVSRRSRSTAVCLCARRADRRCDRRHSGALDGFVLRGRWARRFAGALRGACGGQDRRSILAVILFGLKLGSSPSSARRERHRERRRAVLVSPRPSSSSFILDVNSLLGQNVLINSSLAAIMRRACKSACSCSSTWRARRDWPNGWAGSPSPPGQPLRRGSHAADRRGARRNYRYVGDELIATWKLKEGIVDAAHHGLFAAIDKLGRLRPNTARIGAAIAVRAGLHCGPVVTGEMGSVNGRSFFSATRSIPRRASRTFAARPAIACSPRPI